MLRRVADVLARKGVVALPETATIVEAAALMREEHCGAVLVMDRDGMIGIFTERDTVDRVVAERLDPATTRLKDVMTANPTWIGAREHAIRALQVMEDGGFRHLPVKRDGKVIGVVSRRDFFGEERLELERERHIWEQIG